MLDRLPVRVDPYRLAEQSLTLEGYFHTAKMERLKQSVLGAEEQLTAELGFSKKGAAHYFIQGNVRLNVQLTCQRCLESLDHEINSDFELALVGSELQAEQVLESIETVVGHDIEVVYRKPRAVDIQTNVLDISLAETSLGWKPGNDWLDNLKRSFDWAKSVTTKK